MKMFVDDTPSTTEWLAQKIPEGGKVAFDGRVLSMGEGQEYEEVLGAKNITIEYEVDLIDRSGKTARLFLRNLVSSWKTNTQERMLHPS